MKKLSKFILNNIKILFLISFSLLSRSLYGQSGGGGAIPPTPEVPMATNPGKEVPIDMYEGILIAVAIVLILGYYYYTTQKNKMVKS